MPGALITGCTFTCNEEDLIADSIKNHLPYFDAIIALDKSTDNTPAILESYGAKVITQTETRWHAGNARNLLLGQVTTPWAWFFFPDHRIETTMTPNAVRNMISKFTDRYNILRLRRWNEGGSLEEDGYLYPDWQAEIVRNYVRYTLRIHEVPTYTTKEYLKRYDLAAEPIRIRHLRRPCDTLYRDNDKWARFVRENP